MTFLTWLSETGTDQWISGVVSHNKFLIAGALAIGGAMLKGRFPDFFARLATAVPLVGDWRKRIGG